MADIQDRFGKDMLVLSSPISSELERIGIDAQKDGPFTLLFESEVVEEAYRMEAASGAQCIVADTAFLTSARLAHSRMEGDAQTLANTAINIVQNLRTQHVLVEIAPCGLPLDGSSKTSLIENRDQYSRAAKLFDELEFDAFFLNGFIRLADLKCALMGIRMVSDAPIIASVVLDGDGMLDRAHSIGSLADVSIEDANGDARVGDLSDENEQAHNFIYAQNTESIEQALSVMVEYGADVVGFTSEQPPASVAGIAKRIAKSCTLPALAQLFVRRRDGDQTEPTFENPYFSADEMIDAADALRAAGVQFLRAVGDATPAYTSALVAATDRLDVVFSDDAVAINDADEDLDALAQRLYDRVSKALSDKER